MSFLIVTGNTGFPCMLRLIIWLLSWLAPYGSGLNEELQYLLDHPRRCFTLLFPSGELWRLLGVLILLNGVDFTVFCTLSDTFILPSKYLSVMMYISAFPTAIAMRETNVYEERSLGVYEHDSDSEAESRNGKHIELAVNIQRQPGFDLWYVMLGLFLIALTEGGRLQKAADDPAFWLFSVLFEIVLYGSSGSVRDILRQKQACVPSLIGCQNWSLSQCSCVEDIVDSHTHWIMRFCCHVNRMKMTRRKDRAGWELGSRGVLRV
ncbi:potassium transporter [Aspergillus fischeri NRRL 181]|uniref:Uncharacterized protein n=1 Tax=Neosartorya fischeri (strain ATCC 1020 / DSM 3700 / CBS 544.65 / FGSC A1164 / JCM 1740 / NRRL 181 / WB 181) TaxID=331117 RepID=A1DGN5_NEOFI|nr:uncharacterized protein NFIA_084950 [Aspergillus fischeri NRRL 181]EAW18542.1 hypothetical protein NFIA_084950 [Aspergillus fischeri NRRL 181]